MGGALGPVLVVTQNEMLHCAPGRTDIALRANSGAYNAGIAAGAALEGPVLPLADVQGTFLAGGLLTVGPAQYYSAVGCYLGSVVQNPMTDVGSYPADRARRIYADDAT
ncbi:hypothetical protein [Streptomyces sp. NPDC127197]|uniref:hypothetical protein n=1 Tax=Streptomyces sp. NPDC127197 TaxID=3345388 RepID=UPI00363178C1